MELEELSSYHDLKQWPLLASLEDDLLSQVRLAYVFGSEECRGLLVTKDDKVYLLDGQRTRYGIRPVLDNKLSGKEFAKFSASGDGFALGLTSSGRIYGWGSNQCGQLGFARTETPVELVEIKVDQEGEMPMMVVDVACGSYFAMALTAQGDIFTWGTNCFGEKWLRKEQPTKLTVPSKIVGVACSKYQIVALTDTGMVLCWENKTRGEWFTDPHTPSSLENKIVTKVAAGEFHFIALTKDNCVFCWGSNKYGQLGVSNTKYSTSGVRVSSTSNGFVDIAAIHQSSISMALDSEGLVHIWGFIQNKVVYEPFATPFHSFIKAFCQYTRSEVMLQTVKVKLPTGLSLLDSIKQMFDNQETSDLKFVDQTNGNAVFVHKAILMARSEHFKMMFGHGWKENGQSELPIPTQFTFSIYRTFLRYLYTDEVVVDEDDANQVLGLSNWIQFGLKSVQTFFYKEYLWKMQQLTFRPAFFMRIETWSTKAFSFVFSI